MKLNSQKAKRERESEQSWWQQLKNWSENCFRLNSVACQNCDRNVTCIVLSEFLGWENSAYGSTD